ncbi:MAG: hypothetical protein JO279_09850 [Verrucomicrobia bacterium]|nr:hypothetical protein [Verrucomicrobiota bacterium]
MPTKKFPDEKSSPGDEVQEQISARTREVKMMTEAVPSLHATLFKL